jgi:hypothetical protein
VKFTCEFRNKSNQSRTEVVALQPAEVSSVKNLLLHRGSEESSVMAQAYALAAAYRTMPAGFEHFAVTALTPN